MYEKVTFNQKDWLEYLFLFFFSIDVLVINTTATVLHLFNILCNNYQDSIFPSDFHLELIYQNKASLVSYWKVFGKYQ